MLSPYSLYLHRFGVMNVQVRSSIPNHQHKERTTMKKTTKKAAEAKTAGREKAAAPTHATSAKKAKKAAQPASPETVPAGRIGASAAKQGSRGGTIMALIQRNGGATAAELQQATGWQPHSVRDFLSCVVGKKMGLKLTSARHEDVPASVQPRSLTAAVAASASSPPAKDFTSFGFLSSRSATNRLCRKCDHRSIPRIQTGPPAEA
jgi:hypothetical protein